MHNVFSALGFFYGATTRRLLVAGSLVASTFSLALHAGIEVPEEIRTSLGWQLDDEEDERPAARFGRRLPAHAVRSEPPRWVEARKLTAQWAESAPAIEKAPAETVFRTLARVQALVLSANDASALAELKEERGKLLRLVAAIKAADARGQDGDGWARRSVIAELEQLHRALGEWLADSPAERVQGFRDELALHKPDDKGVLAARYGGPEKLERLVALGRELMRLNKAHQDAQADTSAPLEQRRKALGETGAALGYFYGVNSLDEEWLRAVRDPDVSALFDGEQDRQRRHLAIPDLMLWTGETEASDLLIEAFALPSEISISAHTRTGKLARRLVIEGKLKPQSTPWSLFGWPTGRADRVSAQEVVALHDALKAGYPSLENGAESESDWQRNDALATIAYALAVVGRGEEATSLLRAGDVSRSGFGYRMQVPTEAASAAFDVVLKVAGDTPSADVWHRLLDLAARGERMNDLVALAARRVEATEAGSAEWSGWRLRQGWALVAVDKPDEGLAVLLPALENPPATSDNDAFVLWGDSMARVLKLVAALNRKDEAAKQSARLAAAFKDASNPVWRHSELPYVYLVQAMANGQHAFVEEALRARIERGASSDGKRQAVPLFGLSGKEGANEDVFDLNELVTRLADVLARQGKHADVLELLATSPHWESSDLAQLLGRAGGGQGWRPLVLIAAHSLHAVGRSEEAARVLEAYLPLNRGHDPAYALYVEIRREAALPYLAKLFAADRFEERPLIWSASVLLAAGRVAEAEETIKRAIAIDPSDGEQPKNDRMRAYAVLRDIAAKKGDLQQVEFLSGVVSAIRQSEAADDLAEAGLVDRAIKAYQRALESFADAYCIQSRLARQLAQENRTEEAAEHYRRAFELMPDSFGRVESHCFGCEQAFAGEEVQTIAEKVFLALAEKNPVKPQVHYLLGYLRMEQERWEESATFLWKAVESDPDYLNAWKQLASVLANTARPRAESDRVTFRLIALDPSGSRGGGDTRKVRDLPTLWTALATNAARAPVAPETLFPLGDKAAKKKDGHRRRLDYGGAHTAVERFAEHDLLREIATALNTSSTWAEQP